MSVSTQIKIESGIEIPPSRNDGGSMWDIYLKKMKPGDSILILSNQVGGFQTVARKVGKLIVSRKIDEEMSRCWLKIKENKK